ncbi:ammonium transporter, Amt family [Pilibacter termitis]|uniref:Ammonium transporter n=1 Tax=Pilibacter termitis TaxID=263852 RepID=A0A1T4PLW3_9ENTE|nr:ammonium transporter [Pilibacter termitis]SJZ92540.1 ammonium transporter, Amt family [Pilibacter termitis]
MDTGSIAFILICSALVFLMTPALAFFYGGLERRKNILNTMMMVICTLGIASIMWVAIGYSISFSGDGDFFGNLEHMFMSGVSATKNTLHGLEIPDELFAIFQMMFPLITTAILTGAVVGRMKFGAIVAFIVAWSVLVYYPLAHMVWGGGFLAKIGSIDFAGGNVVHISSGVSGLVLAYVVGKRRDYHQLEYRPHNIPFVVLGAGLLWFGWFGFNAGSALAADGLAVHAFITTNTAAAAGMVSWLIIERILIKKPTVVGACTGAVVGLVGITPGAGFVSIGSAIVIGLVVSPVCYFFISALKRKLGLDDALDAFGCHGVGGIVGGIMTGIFTTKELALESGAGLFYGETKLFIAQLLSIVFTIVYAALISFVIIKVIGLFLNIRVSEREEAIGMDDTEHDETAYPTFMGLDS